MILRTPDLWLDFAVFYLKTGEIVNAVQVLKTGLIHQPQNPAIIYRLVAMLLLNNSVNQALFYLERALTLDPRGVNEFLHFFPTALDFPAIAELIESYQQKAHDRSGDLSSRN